LVLALNEKARRLKRGGVAYYQLPDFASSRAVLHAFSTRVGGVSRGRYGTLNLGYKTQDDPLRVRQNRDLFARAIGIRAEQFVHVEQVHGSVVLEAKAEDRGKCLDPGEYLGQADAIVTRAAKVALMIQVADCLPVLVHDPVKRAIGIAHAGWRGTVDLVAVKTLLKMEELYGTKPSDVRVALGPSIGPCCCEVGEEVADAFEEFPWASEVLKAGFGGNRMLDLPEANARQLIDIGVKREGIVRSDLCTIGNIGDFYSHRAEAIPSSVSPSRTAATSGGATVGRPDAVRASGQRVSEGRSTGRIAAVIMLV